MNTYHPGTYLLDYMTLQGIDATDLADASNVVPLEDWESFIDGSKDLNPLITAELCVMFDFDAKFWNELDRIYNASNG